MLTWKTVLILVVLVSLATPTLASGNVTIEYSLDNATWYNITSVDQNAQNGYQILLHPDTLYYFRGKDNETAYLYLTQRTAEGLEGSMTSLAVAATFIFLTSLVVLAIVYAAWWLRVLLFIPLLWFLSALFLYVGKFVEINYADQTALIESIQWFYTITVNLVYPMYAVGLFWVMFLLAVAFQSWFSKKKKKNNLGELGGLL